MTYRGGTILGKGYIHVYTGNGKGKTTAALGLSLRAVCAGKKVYIGQFVKGQEYSETKCVQYLPNIEIHQFGTTCFIDRKPTEEDVALAKEGYKVCANALKNGEYDLVVLDEINIAMYYKLLGVDEVIEMIKNRAEHVEVVITGRYAPEEILEIADLVTEMKEIKHYYSKGILAREGIEN